MHGITAALPLFRAQQTGHFVNVASAAAHRIVPNMAVYAAAKSAVRTKPLTLAYALSDSPAGLVTWMAEKWSSWSDGLNCVSTEVMDIILSEASLYWISNTIATSFLPYLVYDWPPGARVDGAQVKVPVGFYLSAAEIGGVPPESFARRQFEVARWSVLPRGGHFMATEQPELLGDNLLAFVRAFR